MLEPPRAGVATPRWDQTTLQLSGYRRSHLLTVITQYNLDFQQAEMQGCEQVLWVFGEDQEVTEVGAMNLFVLLKEAGTGHVELVTPPLTSGTVLPGVTRQSVLELAGEIAGLKVRERRLTLPELLAASREGRLLEMFGSGTAAIISPVGGLRSVEILINWREN